MEGSNPLEEEVSSVKSIFPEINVSKNDKRQTELTYGQAPNTVSLTITDNYPNEVPIITLPPHLHSVGLMDHLMGVALPLVGGPMLYAVVDAAKDWIEDNKVKIETLLCDKGKKETRAVCKFFLQGKCRFGIHCISIHPGATTNPETHSSLEPDTRSSVEPEANQSTPKSKQKEAKKDSSHSKKSPKSNTKPNEDEEVEKKERMRTATEVISRILWDPDLPSEDFTVGYLDRFVGIQEKAFKEFSWEDISTVGADVLAVPKHRIQYFKYKERIVWDKRSQTDDFFGSRGGKTIDMIVDKPVDTDAGSQKENKENSNENGVELIHVGDELEEDRPLAHRRGNQLRPTHFVCLRVTDEEVKVRVQKVIDHVTKLNPQLADGIIKAPSLHVTLCMIQLLNDDQIETAKKVFKSCRLQFLSLLPRCVKIEFTGVDNFRERLIFIKVKPLPGLSRFVAHAIEQFQAAGLKTPGNHDEYTPHITLIKLSRPMQRQLDTKLINPECYRPFLTKDLGFQPITSLHLCAMHAPAQPDGFYLKYATITNSLLGLPHDFAQLVEEKLVNLKERGYLENDECDALVGKLRLAFSQSDEDQFDTVIKELVRTNGEVKTFESSSIISSTNVIIMRGLPGSGKSYLCSHCHESQSDPSQTVIISADHFFTEGSTYQFNPVTAFKAHQQCIARFLEALCAKKRLVLIDNTNTQQWEYTIYTYLCEVLGIQCHVLEIPCPSPSICERFRCRNQHKIQVPAITKMLQRWEKDDRAVIVPPLLAYPRDWSSMQPQPFSILELCKGSYTPLPEVIKESKNLVAIYSGIFLTSISRWEVLSMFHPSHSDIHSSHVTLAFGPDRSKLKKLPVGKKVKISITGHAENSKAQACVVEIPLSSENKTAHITISTVEGVPPKSTNIMLQNQVVHSCDTKVVEGVVGVVIRQATDEEIQGEEPSGEKVASMASYIVTSSNDLKVILPHLLNDNGAEESVSDEGHSSTGILTGEQKITKLFVFDFDGTLVIPPGPFDGRRMYEQETGEKWPHKGWLGWPESLLPPMRVFPGPALAEFRSHVDRAGSSTIILTGRVENTKPGFMKVLENFQIFPDKVYFKPDITDESTAAFKLRIIKQLLTTEFSEVTLVKFWDDMYDNLWAIKWLSQAPEVSHVQFDIIDATEMASTSSISKHGKKISLSKSPTCIKYKSVLEEHLAAYGFLPTTVYQAAAREGIEFIANQFSKIIGYEGNPLHLLYPFGSYPLRRVSDVDMCFIAPDTHKSAEWIEKMASQLQSCGIKYIHVGLSSRCPRLKIMLMYANATPIEYDIVVALIPKESLFANASIEQLPATKIAEMRKPGDNVSKVALSGPLFMQRIEAVLEQSCVTLESFGAVVEMIAQILVAQRERGNAYHCIRTFHIVQLLVEFIQQNGSTLPAEANSDVLFKRFIGFVSEAQYDKWQSLFGEFVPEAYIPRVMAVFKECSQVLKPAEPVSTQICEQLLRRSSYPPNGYIPVDIKISGKNDVLKWKAGIIVEARLPSYVRQVISHGLDVRPDGNIKNTKKYSFSVPPLKSAKDTLQQVLRPFWVELAELRKQDGLTIQLNFDQPMKLSSTSPALDALGRSTDPKASDILEQVTQFAASKNGPRQLHLPTTLTSHARLLVHEAAERLGLKHSSIGNGKDRHVVLEKH